MPTVQFGVECVSSLRGIRSYGSQAIRRDNHVAFMAATARLDELGAPGEVLALCRSMSREGLALEQEAVWHAPSPGHVTD